MDEQGTIRDATHDAAEGPAHDAPEGAPENAAEGPADGTPEPAAEPARRRRRPWRTALVVVASLALLAVLGAGGAALWFDRKVERFGDPFEAIPEESRPAKAPVAPGEQEPMNFLVLGSDSRISAGDPGSWVAGAQRTDAIMLVHLDGDREHATVMSIPRDSWVDVPGYGEAKINAAYSWGGPSLLVQTVENLLGVRVDHVAVADFTSFTELTDALGGVEITVPEDTYDRGRLVVEQGTHTLDGEQALAYARQRYGLPGGDFDRVRRQQNWARAILAKAVSDGTLSDPGRLTSFVSTVAGAVAVDDGLGLDDMVRLATGARGLRPSSVAFLTVPVTGTGWSPDGTQSIVVLDEEALAPLAQAIADDDVTRFLAEDPRAPELLGDEVR